MKAEILKILEMQAEGKLTREQAAELLAVLADGAREKNEQDARTGSAPSAGGCSGAGSTGGGAFRDFVDKVTEMGTKVGHSASIWGGEIMNTVHRDEGGNSVTLSKLDAPPLGENGVFRGNVLSLSKVARLTLNRSELANNIVTASKFSRVELTESKFTQCDISGSSLTELTLVNSVIRAVVFAGVKCARLRLEGNSALDGCTVQATSMKGLTGTEGTTLRGVTIAGCMLADVTMRQTTLEQVRLSDCKADGLMLEECAWRNCQLIACKMRGTKIRGVTLEGRVLRNLDLSGKTIEGDEAFAREVGL
ncbi:MAG TPA: pentapeptide repeat-containing protein [Phycisphaerae bacterium]|nr:pentapeptide repeat-containing protein [Phycisphaerae bacterium]